MSTAKRLVLSLRGRKNSECNTATSSTRLVSAGASPGHELDEIAVVSGTGESSHHFTYGGIGSNITNGPRYSTGKRASKWTMSFCSFVLLFKVPLLALVPSLLLYVIFLSLYT